MLFDIEIRTHIFKYFTNFTLLDTNRTAYITVMIGRVYPLLSFVVLCFCFYWVVIIVCLLLICKYLLLIMSVLSILYLFSCRCSIYSILFVCLYVKRFLDTIPSPFCIAFTVIFFWKSSSPGSTWNIHIGQPFRRRQSNVPP